MPISIKPNASALPLIAAHRNQLLADDTTAGFIFAIDAKQKRIVALKSDERALENEVAVCDAELAAWNEAAAKMDPFYKKPTAPPNIVKATTDAISRRRNNALGALRSLAASIAEQAEQRDVLAAKCAEHLPGCESMTQMVPPAPVAAPVTVAAPATDEKGRPYDQGSPGGPPSPAAVAAAERLNKKHRLTGSEERKCAELCTSPIVTAKLESMDAKSLLSLLRSAGA